MLFPLFSVHVSGNIWATLLSYNNKDIAYKIISIFLFFVTFFSLRRLKEKSRLLPRKPISCESYFSL